MNHVIYNRVSTEDQGDNGVSLEAMEASCRAYVTSQGGQLVKVYTDVKSGANMNRPHLQELLHDVQSHSIPTDVVLVWRLDRLSRSQVDTLKLIDFFTKHKVAFKSVTEPFDTATPVGQAMLGMLSTFAQFERKSIAQRTKHAMAAKAATKRMGGYAPLGYRLEADGNLAPDPDESQVVELIFRRYRQGKSLKEIADALNKRGVATRSGSAFRPETVRRILHNPIYTGQVVWDRAGLNVQNGQQHEGLVKTDAFARVQQRIETRRSMTKHSGGGSVLAVSVSAGVHDPRLHLQL
jgi:site-specific DNA recombinase